ncbi:hypothetical protein FJZ18_01160 [Candidatus Pacearchaeota archaeon]|nr:hypothetical protein [Candidatus Pacearchaeota archaeon]
MKALIFDSGTLINLSMNGLLYVLEKLKKNCDCYFLITSAVKHEIIDRPLSIQRFELGALNIQALMDSGVLNLPSVLGIKEEDIDKDTRDIMDMANHYIQVNGKWVSIVSEAEISCLALNDILSKRGFETLIAIDERTTRMLCESPESLERVMSEKIHQKVDLIAQNFKIFHKYRFVRSSELVYVVYKKGLINLKGNKVLEALLYATKFHGAAISFEEIDILKKL